MFTKRLSAVLIVTVAMATPFGTFAQMIGSSRSVSAAGAGMNAVPVNEGDVLEGTIDGSTATRTARGTYLVLLKISQRDTQTGLAAFRFDGPARVKLLVPDAKGEEDTPGWKNYVYPAAKIRANQPTPYMIYPSGYANVALRVETLEPGKAVAFRMTLLTEDAAKFRGSAWRAALEKAVSMLDTPTVALPNLAEQSRFAAAATSRASLVNSYSRPVDEAGMRWASAKAAPLRPFYEALYADGEQNAALNLERLGLAAIETGNFAQAAWAFDGALDRIEAIYSDDPAAKRARSLWGAESVKDYKGESYERAMAYYYRGLLYLRDGDFDNARASFTSAEFQDTVSEDEVFRSDFGLLNYLAGWSTRCAGDAKRAEEMFAAAAASNPALAAPPPEARTLVLIEAGGAPVKVAHGMDGQLLGYAPSDDQEEGAPDLIDGTPMHLAADIFHQANTRGDRSMDEINQQQQQVKSTVRKMGLVGGAVAGFMEAAADLRMWETLPARIYFAVKGAESPRAIVPSGADLHGLFSANPRECALVWARSRSALKTNAAVVGNSRAAAEKRAQKPASAERDAAFRQWLVQTSPER